MTQREPDDGADAMLRHKFAGGALESASHILGSSSAGVFVAGLIGPYVAALDHPPGMSSGLVLGAAAICLGFSMVAGLGAMTLRGLGRCAAHGPRRSPPALQLAEVSER